MVTIVNPPSRMHGTKEEQGYRPTRSHRQADPFPARARAELCPDGYAAFFLATRVSLENLFRLKSWCEAECRPDAPFRPSDWGSSDYAGVTL